ncbi:MAG: GAF domain-containing protein, partial [Candidatus Omnitrophica bacterium]|nr:GAF domain-containing protein [Candidatus Omnitrophota bacterium]
YAIIRHHLMDIKIVVARAVIFLLIYIPILMIPVCLGYYISGKTFLLSWVVPVITATILAPAGLFIYLRLQSKAEKRLLQEEYKYRALIKRIADQIGYIHDIDEGTKLITDELYNGMNVEHVTVYVLDKEYRGYLMSAHSGVDGAVKSVLEANPLVQHMLKKKKIVIVEELYDRDRDNEVRDEMMKFDAALVVPIQRENQLLGFVAMGSKKTGKIYTDLEIEALNFLSVQTVLMVENVLTFTEKQNLQMKLMDTQRMAELGYLACAMGHQINNNINIILSAVQFLQMDIESGELIPKDEVARERLADYVNDMLEPGYDSRKIIDELATYGRPQTMDNLNEDIELQEVFQKALRIAKLRNKKFDQVMLEQKLMKSPAIVLGNFVQLQNVFVNLLNNSFDAILMEKNHTGNNDFSGQITVSLAEEGFFYAVYFEDNGIGMNEEVQKRVFKIPMFTTKGSGEKRSGRENESENDITGGTGIGTYAVRMIVLAHNGEIEIKRSAPHEGSEIHLRLPKKQEEREKHVKGTARRG